MNKVIIIGAGPAGLTAAIYLGRAGFKPLVLEGEFFSGQLATAPLIENFPGFSEGIVGLDLLSNMRNQAEKFGAEIISDKAEKVELSEEIKIVYTGEKELEARVIILAPGAKYQTLNIPGEETYWHKGISTCAVCDGALPIYRNKIIGVVGGGDSALEEAIYLSQFASQVNVFVRRDVLRASAILQKRAEENPKINIIRNTILVSAEGDNNLLTHLNIKNVVTGKEEKVESQGLFYAIGHVPNTDFLKDTGLLDEKGYIITKINSKTTIFSGVFSAGDANDFHYRQVVVAAGAGAKAALEAISFLQ